MKSEKANKKAVCKKFEKTNILVKGSDKVLRNKNLSSFRNKNEQKGDEEMTLKQIVRLIIALKEKSHTLDEIIEILEHMANDT